MTGIAYLSTQTTMMILALLVATFALASPDAVGQAEQSGASTPSFAERTPRYRLQLNDELEISFRFTPEFNQKASVQPDGYISLPDVGDVHVAGLTLEQVREAIVAKYSGILHNPIVTVKLASFTKPFFIVGGEVTKPGRYDLAEALTLSDAVAVAGGFTIGARSTEVLLFRRFTGDTVEVKKVNVKLAQSGSFNEDVRLRPGDAVFVPISKVGKIDRFMSVTRLGFYFPLPVF